MEKYKTIKIIGKEFVDSKEIEYKAIDTEVFNRDHYSAKKFDLKYDKDGYLTDSIINAIDLKESSTDILNVATGSGKTTAIYKLIEKILEFDDKSIIIMATPFISLVNKDVESLTKDYGLKEEIITDYRELKKKFEVKYAGLFGTATPIVEEFIKGKRIHIITINALLRNPGDVAFEQQAIKTEYLNYLIDYCKETNNKVYLIIDEIHASIHNFKNEFIHYLTMWHGVVHKVIVSTATFTEPVYIAIKHLAYSTKDKINIYESKRIKQFEVSPLDILFFPNKYDKNDLDLLSSFISGWINKNKYESSNYHILSYSRKLAEELSKTNLGDNTNLVTSRSKLQFNKDLNNIGTGFSTGVNIDKKGDLFIILFPCKYSDELVKGDEGIFNNGLPSILQAIARLRQKGRILFVIPPMEKIIKTGITINLWDVLLKNVYNQADQSIFVKEDFLKREEKLLERIIDRNERKVHDEINRYNINTTNEERKHVNRPSIQFPTPSTFILEKGQEYLKYTNYKSGKYITPYVLWAALHDQFINCSLDIIYSLKRNNINIYLSSSAYFDGICNHYDKFNFENKPESFDQYFNQIENIFGSIKEGQENFKVNIFVDDKKINKDAFFKRIDVFIAILNHYFRIMDLQNENKFEKFIDYILHPINNENPSIRIIKNIANDFVSAYAGKKFLTKDIFELDFFTQDIIEKISYCIKDIIKNDPVISLAKSKGISFANNINNRSSIITFLIESFVKRGNKDNRGQRMVIGPNW